MVERETGGEVPSTKTIEPATSQMRICPATRAYVPSRSQRLLIIAADPKDD
jgi:hypothetical protein